VGRLENIIARNRRPVGVRATIGLVWRGLFILFILGALIFTDWALTDDSDGGSGSGGSGSGGSGAVQPAARPRPDERHIDGVRVLRTQPRAGGRAAGSASAAPPPASPAP
jgi:hypothetical protein